MSARILICKVEMFSLLIQDCTYPLTMKAAIIMLSPPTNQALSLLCTLSESDKQQSTCNYKQILLKPASNKQKHRTVFCKVHCIKIHAAPSLSGLRIIGYSRRQRGNPIFMSANTAGKLQARELLTPKAIFKN